MKKYVFDIDGTICNTKNSDYENSTPIFERIRIINRLYEEGNTIYFFTARGMGRAKDCADTAIKMFYDLTFSQLESWGVKHHGLFLGKPSGDFYIDDKGVKDEDFFKSE